MSLVAFGIVSVGDNLQAVSESMIQLSQAAQLILNEFSALPASEQQYHRCKTGADTDKCSQNARVKCWVNERICEGEMSEEDKTPERNCGAHGSQNDRGGAISSAPNELAKAVQHMAPVSAR